MAKKPRLKSGATLGGEQAEADPLRQDAFVSTPLYEVMASKDDSRCFVVGRTGSGKSAALQHLEENQEERVVRISPEDLSLPYITDLQVIKYLDSIDVKLDLFWYALWKHVLVVEIIRRRYKIETPEAKQRFLSGLRDKLKRDPAKQEALQYLDDFEGKFWVEADERVRHITDRFTDRIGASGGGELGIQGAKVKASAGGSREEEWESKTELADRYQRIVNETQLARLNKMLTILNDEILDDAHFTYVIIDDLDRDWVDERISNDLIRCLFRTVLDMQRVKNLKILVALRTNIFQELDFGRSGGQEEKFRALVLEMNWTPGLLEDVLDERVRLLAGRAGLEANSMKELLPHANRTRGNPLEYMLERTLLRPRDLISFANSCITQAAGKSAISWEDIQSAERSYSANRVLALRDEWKPTYPGIEALFENFRGAPGRIDRSDLTSRFDDAMLLLSDGGFPGVRWMTSLARPLWEGADESSWSSLYRPVGELLYRVGFLGYAERSAAAPKFFSADPLYAESDYSFEKTQYAFVHRMFHKALDISLARDGEQP